MGENRSSDSSEELNDIGGDIKIPVDSCSLDSSEELSDTGGDIKIPVDSLDVHRLKLTAKELFEIENWSQTLEQLKDEVVPDEVFEYRSAKKEHLPIEVPTQLRTPIHWRLNDECGEIYEKLLVDLGEHLDSIDVRTLKRRCRGDCNCIVQRSPVGNRGGSVRNVLCARKELHRLGEMEKATVMEVCSVLVLVSTPHLFRFFQSVSMIIDDCLPPHLFRFFQGGTNKLVLHVTAGIPIKIQDLKEICIRLDRPVKYNFLTLMTDGRSRYSSEQEKAIRRELRASMKVALRQMQRSLWPGTTYWSCTSWPHRSTSEPLRFIRYNSDRLSAFRE
jgi:hypothetical protein